MPDQRCRSNQLEMDDIHTDFNERLYCLLRKNFQRDDWPRQNGTLEYPPSKLDLHHRPTK